MNAAFIPNECEYRIEGSPLILVNDILKFGIKSEEYGFAMALRATASEWLQEGDYLFPSQCQNCGNFCSSCFPDLIPDAQSRSAIKWAQDAQLTGNQDAMDTPIVINGWVVPQPNPWSYLTGTEINEVVYGLPIGDMNDILKRRNTLDTPKIVVEI